MPILSYFAVMGSVLVALLFVADATMEKSGPLPFNNESVGLPPAWRADHVESKTAILAATPAPEPDMTSEAVRAAAPPDAVVVAAAKTEAAPERMAKLEAPKKPKRVAHRQLPPRDDFRQSYAWSRNDFGPFGGGGGGLFGRF
jgi:hypothetical protein